MDNRIANDMISSGMIPSGEKKKEDLSRTQYGSAPSPSKLMDAYKSMYEHHKKDADGNTIPHEGEELNEGKIPAGLQAYLDKKKGKKEDKKDMKEDADLFDVLSNKLIEEGYSKEESYKIMKGWKKNRSVSIKSSAYDTYFGLSTTALASDDEFEVKEDATKAEIKRAFGKSLKGKKMNKKILSEFIELVA